MVKAGFQRGGAEMLHAAIMRPYRPEHEIIFRRYRLAHLLAARFG